MQKLCIFIGMSVLSTVGWWIGSCGGVRGIAADQTSRRFPRLKVRRYLAPLLCFWLLATGASNAKPTTNAPAGPDLDGAELQRLSAMEFGNVATTLRTKPPEICVRYLLALTLAPRAGRDRKFARQCLDLALDIAQQAKLAHETGQTLFAYAVFEDANRDLIEAMARVNAALRVFEKLEFTEGIRSCLWLKGNIEDRRGALPDSVSTFERLQKLSTGRENDVLRAHCMAELAALRYKMGQGQNGDARAREAMAVYEERGETKGVADCLKLLGNIASDRKDFAAAIEYYDKAAEKYKEVNNIHGQANCHYNTGITRQQMREYSQSVAALQEAIAEYTQSSSVTGVGIANMELGHTYRLMNDLAKSEAALLLAQKLLTKSQDLWRLAQADEGLAQLRLTQDRKADAIRHYHDSLTHYEQIKMTAEAARVRAVLETLENPKPPPSQTP